MSLSPDERRELVAINQFLAQDDQLVALAGLFAEPPEHRESGRVRAVPAALVPDRSRRRGILGGLVAAVLAVVAGCVLASLSQPLTITAGAVLILCSAGALLVALVRSITRPESASE